MNQPNLGKKIIELRKAKGFTQKELVDKCNLNVRTLQRIESGEVTPRNHTLKLILETLNYQSDNLYEQRSRFYNWIEKASPFRYKTTISLLSICLVILIIVSAYYFSNSNSSELKAKSKIEASQKKMTEWVNSRNLDSIISKYRIDACVSNNVCGKENIKNLFKRVFSEGYKIIKYTSISMDVNHDVAFEKYTSIYEHKGTTHQQFGITEWRFSDGEWLIVNEVYNE